MSFRRRVALASAAAVAVAVVLASVLTYLLSAHQLRSQVDAQLTSRADTLRLSIRPNAPAQPTLLEVLKPRHVSGARSSGGTPAPVNPLGNNTPRPPRWPWPRVRESGPASPRSRWRHGPWSGGRSSSCG